MILQECLNKKYFKEQQQKEIYVAFSFQNLTSLENDGHLINLKRLYIEHNQLTTLKGIELIPNLEKIWIHNNPLEDISNLKDLKYLEFIRATKKSIPEKYHHFFNEFENIGGKKNVEKLQLFLKAEFNIKNQQTINLLF